MVIDSSAIAAIVFREPHGTDLLAAAFSASDRLLSAATLVEVGMVVESRRGAHGALLLRRLLADVMVDVVPVDERVTWHVMDGWRRFGKGRHPAALNFGDCFTYGLAALTGQPVLCVGNDFPQTDVAVVPLDAGQP